MTDPVNCVRKRGNCSRVVPDTGNVLLSELDGVCLCDLVRHFEKSLADDWTGVEGTEVLKLDVEPPKVRGYPSQLDTWTETDHTDCLT